VRFVEFDVQLTKDNIPVIVHDEEIHVKTIAYDSAQIKLKVPICKIDVNKLRMLRPVMDNDHPIIATMADIVKRTAMRRSKSFDRSVTQDFPQLYDEEKPKKALVTYPTLEETFNLVPEDVGFNVEIKYAETEEYEKNFWGSRREIIMWIPSSKLFLKMQDTGVFFSLPLIQTFVFYAH